jgi:hypothetical protein
MSAVDQLIERGNYHAAQRVARRYLKPLERQRAQEEATAE